MTQGHSIIFNIFNLIDFEAAKLTDSFSAGCFIFEFYIHTAALLPFKFMVEPDLHPPVFL